MNNSNEEQRVIKTDRNESIAAVQATKSGHLGQPSNPTTFVSQRKGWHFASLVVLMPVGAIGVILYLLRSAFADEFEGIGAALCAVACGGFLVLHVNHLFAEEDKLQNEQLNASQTTVSPSLPHPVGPQTSPTALPPDAGEKCHRLPGKSAVPEA